MFKLFLIACFSMTMCPALFAAVSIIPHPKEITDRAMQWAFGPSDAWIIVTGAASDSVEAFAASMLRSDISRRFHKTCDIRRENESAGGYSLKILLGRRGSHALIDQICTANSYPLYADTPGVHGYVIRMLDHGGVKTALIGSMDANGALYGRSSFFQLLSKSNDTVFVNLADVRDWPSIRDRGRSYWRYTDFLRNGALDALVRGRLNTIDMRASCSEYSGCSGTNLVSDMDSAKARALSGEAHRRGMFVWGTVKSGISSPAEIPGRMELFRRYLYSWGADGLWASYDDAGGGNIADTLMKALIRFADSADLARSRVRILPPVGAYDRVYSAWADTLVRRAPDTKSARWIWTDNPGPAKLAAAESLGLSFKPEWWWNGPRPAAGFTHDGYRGNPIGDSLMYNEMLPLQQGWSYGWEPNPDFESAAMRESWKYLSGTLFWAPDLQDEYLAMGFGLWAWCPEQYSFNEVRQYCRETVFGDKGGTAAAFENSLARLRAMFDRYAPRPWPLSLSASRSQAESLAVDCAKRLDSLRRNPSTLLDSLRYAERYVAAMEKAVRTAHEYLGLSFHPGVYTDSTPPSAPTGLAASFTGMVSLSWNAASDLESGILGYDIFRGSRPDSLSYLRTTPDSTGASDVFDGTGDTLYYAIRAVNRNSLRSPAFSNTVFVVLPAFDSAYLGAGADTLFSFTSTQVRAYVRFSDGTIDSSGLTVRFFCLDTALLSVTASGRALARDTSGIARVIASRGGAWIPDTCRIAVARSPIRLLKRFDFRCSAVPVLADWIPENGSPYDSAKGYGWSGCASPLESRCDRYGGALLGTFVMVRGSACTTGVFRVNAPDGGYIVRIGLGDASYPAEPLFVMHGSDTIARFTAPGNLGNGYSVCDDTITVSGGAGASFLVRGTPNAKISYLIILSDQGIAMSDVAEDGLPPLSTDLAAVSPEKIPLRVLPNPFNPMARIEVSGSREGTVLVYAPSGRLVARLALKNGAAEWNAAALPSGIYMVQARVGKQVLRTKAALLK